MALQLEKKMKYCKKCMKRTEHARVYEATGFGMGFFIVLLTIFTVGLFLLLYFPLIILQYICMRFRKWNCTECGK